MMGLKKLIIYIFISRLRPYLLHTQYGLIYESMTTLLPLPNYPKFGVSISPLDQGKVICGIIQYEGKGYERIVGPKIIKF